MGTKQKPKAGGPDRLIRVSVDMPWSLWHEARERLARDMARGPRGTLRDLMLAALRSHLKKGGR